MSSGTTVCPDLSTIHRVHLVGVCGTAMTPLATILAQMGLHVTGSDLTEASWVPALLAENVEVRIGHRPENVGEAQLVIASSAVLRSNVEVETALARGIPVVKHSAALGRLMRGRRTIAVAGTHGKTTTSALISVMLAESGMDPTIHVGSELINYQRFGRLGRGDWLVAEADEFDRRFLDYRPEIEVVTSLEPDHLDYFGSFAALQEAFRVFLTQLQPGGTAILCADEPAVRALAGEVTHCITYGFADDADWRIASWQPSGLEGCSLVVSDPDGEPHKLRLGLFGRHNVLNACAAVVVGSTLGLTMEQVRHGLSCFRGTRRRFEIIGRACGITVVDDYAHHPTAIRATIRAARQHLKAPLWVVFQPHTAHRTMSLLRDFATAFDDADHVAILPTYRPAGRERHEEDPSVPALVSEMTHPDCHALSEEAAAWWIAEGAQSGDTALIMGAGDVWTIEPRILALLAERR